MRAAPHFQLRLVVTPHTLGMTDTTYAPSRSAPQRPDKPSTPSLRERFDALRDLPPSPMADRSRPNRSAATPTLHLPKSLSARVRGESFSGNLDIPGANVMKTKYGRGSSIEHRYGSGSGEITIENFSGDTELRLE